MESGKNNFCVLILAAGKGTRMHSEKPKVLQNILEEPILFYPIEAVRGAGFRHVSAVVGYAGEQVAGWLQNSYPDVETIWQREQLGTGHAVKIAADWWKRYDHVLILPGDTPLITSDTLRSLMERHVENNNQCTFLSFDIPDPEGYGRVIRDGLSVRIVEHKDATAEERKCREVNSGMYVFSSSALASVIDDLGCENHQKEYYLPDAIPLIHKAGGRVEAFKASSHTEFHGVNDPIQMAESAECLRTRILNEAMRKGLKCMDPRSTWIGPEVVIGEDVTIEPNVQIWGKSEVGNCARIGSFSVLRGAKIGNGAALAGSVRIQDSVIGDHVTVGPFVFIRENTVLAEHVHVGRFVEIKKSVVGKSSKIPHLSYIGDTEIGTGTNIGAGTITCNYDGVKKNKTKIGSNCFIGSDTMLVAPVELEDNAVTGAGSVITQDVPEGALAVARARQRNIEGWHSRKQKNEGGKD